MVDYYGRWSAETDYTNYPEEKICDCDRIAAWIMKTKYQIRTTIENLVEMILISYESYIEEKNQLYRNRSFYLEDVQEYVEESGGLMEFDYIA